MIGKKSPIFLFFLPKQDLFPPFFYRFLAGSLFNTLMTVFGCYGIPLYFCDVFLPQGIYEALFLPHRGQS
jgi:hypothetical protein